MNFALDFIRGLVAKSPARLIGYGSTAAVFLVTFLAAKANLTLDDGTLAAVGLLGAAIVTEAIRRFVYSPNTTQAIANQAAETGNPDIGAPPAGPG